MATILELADRGKLIKLDPELDSKEMELRCIYVFPHVTSQIEELRGAESNLGKEIGPFEQLFAFLADFASGEEMIMPEQFHDLRHREDGIWELKTPDLRFFGWFHKQDIFVCTAIKDATFVKHGPESTVQISGSLYHAFGSEVVRYRAQIDLDPPKYVAGIHPENVISNFASR